MFLLDVPLLFRDTSAIPTIFTYDGIAHLWNLPIVSNALKSLLLVMEVNTQLILRKMADDLRLP